MNTKLLAMSGLALVLLVGTAGAAPPGSGPGEDTAEAGNVSEAGLDVDVEKIDRCGRTCRDVTLSLTNENDTAAENVTVTSHIYAGQDTDGTVIWSDTRTVGTLAPNGTVTETERVDLSLREAFAVQTSGGWITAETTVHSDDGDVTHTEQRQAL